MRQKLRIPKWTNIRHNIVVGPLFWIVVLTPVLGKGEDPYPFLKNLFSEKEREQIQLYLKDEYHSQKRHLEIQNRAREFFRSLSLWERQQAMKENSLDTKGLLELEKRGVGQNALPFYDLLKFLNTLSNGKG